MESVVADECHLSQPLRDTSILSGVTAYVEVWSGSENRSECVKIQLTSLGARIEEKFNNKVTHVLFNEGSRTTYKKARKRNIPMLSVLWIEESKRLLSRACEETYCALHLDAYEEPDIFSSPSVKRPRRTVPYRRGFRKKKKSSQDKENEPYEAYFNPNLFNENAALIKIHTGPVVKLCPECQLMWRNLEEVCLHRPYSAETCRKKDGIIGTLEHVTGEKFSSIQEDDIFPCSQMSADINEPLTKKLYNRFLAEEKEDLDQDSSSRHSCPSKLSAQDDDKPSENGKFLIPRETFPGWPSGTKGLETNLYKKAQIPITFFFKASLNLNKMPSLVFTGLDSEEVQLLTSIVEKIGGFQVEKAVSSSCRHVVCSYPPKRTVNMLRGIARGCWILSKEWILKSLDSNKWLNEEEFELNYFLPAIMKVRIAREKSMPSIFRHYLFSRHGPFHVGASCSSPPASDVRELLLLCGGYVVSCARAAKIVIAGQGKSSSTSMRRAKDQIYVTEKWVLDSISEDSICPFVPPYLLETHSKRRST